MTPEERAELIAIVSKMGGEQAALSAALLGLLRITGGVSQVAEAVREQLEQAYAHHHGCSTNQAFLDGFESAQALILLALAHEEN